MRRLHFASIAVAAATAILLLAIWQVPQWLDWTRYRGTIELIASATLGHTVTIHGSISLTLLPQPVLTASQVDVGGPSATDLAMRVDALRLRIALLPLIGGRVDARELVLRGADLRIPWPAGPAMARLRPPGWLAAFAARIEDGRLSVGRIAFTGIEASLTTLDTGALSASGTAQFGGQEWHFTARLTAAGSDGAAGLNVALDGRGKANGLGANFSGQLALDGTVAGTIAVRGPNLALLLPTPPLSFRVDGHLQVGNGVAALDDLALELDGSPARAQVALRVTPTPRLDVTLAASRLDLDAWLPALLSPRATAQGIDLPTSFDLSAGAAPLGGGTLQQVRATLDLDGKDLFVRRASALLPGNGSIRLSGRADRGDPLEPGFDGDVALDAPMLHTTLHWLDHALPAASLERVLRGLPDAVGQRAALSAHLTVAAGEVALRQLAGTLDGAPFTGALAFKRGEPRAAVLDLSLDRLTLDPWLPRLSRLTGLTGLDAEVRLNVRQAEAAGTAIDRLAMDAGIEAGNLVLRRLEGTALGAHFAASGTLGDSGRLTSGRLSIDAGDAGGLSDLLPVAWRATPALWAGPATLTVEAAGPKEALTSTLRLDLGGAHLEANSTADLMTREWRAVLALQHPGARRLLAALGVQGKEGLRSLPDWLGDGSLSLVAHLSGAPGHLAAEHVDLTAATLHAKGDLAFDLGGTAPHVSGHVDADAVMLPLPAAGSDVPLPLGMLGGWDGHVQLRIGKLAVGAAPELHDASVTLALSGGRLGLEDFAARLASGTVSGSLVFDAAASPPSLMVEARLNDAVVAGPIADAPIDLLSGTADASIRLTASGYSPSALLTTLDGRLTIAVREGTLSGFDMFRLKLAMDRPDPKAAEAAANDALRSGTTGFDRLDVAAHVAHGDLFLDQADMTGAAGDADFSGGINLASRTLDVRIGLHPALPNPPRVAIHLTGPIDRPDLASELDELARWMAALAH